MNINYDPKILQEVKALEQEAVTKTDLNDFGDRKCTFDCWFDYLS